ncbi:hypothetical protein [Halobaculum sp. D14]|uniref:hypothetical protein n=1 Tax=unclassified Halobaculum TaxID=2640896 RepID=UPI003EBD91AB
MSGSLVDRIWDDVSARVGDDLRAVTRYDVDGYETRKRGDVEPQYSDREKREMIDDTIVTQLNLADTETAFKAGELHALVRVFDEAWVVSWTDRLPKKSGVMVSIQRGSDATMADVEWVVDYLETGGDGLFD